MTEQVVARAKFRCEYCQTQQAVVGRLEVDHVIPESLGGATTFDNLCYACRRCNGSKYNFMNGVDPDTGQNVPLFNPRKDKWAEHFRWSCDGYLVEGLTATGRATIRRLNMNSTDKEVARRLWVKVGWHPPKDTDEEEDTP